MGLIKGALKSVGIAAAATGVGYVANRACGGIDGLNLHFLANMVEHAATALTVYYAAVGKYSPLKYKDGGLEGILKGVVSTGAKMGGVYLCTYDLASVGSLDIPGKIGYVWNLAAQGASKIALPIDLIANHTPLPDTHLEKTLYDGMSLNGLSKSLSAKDVAVYTTGAFSIMGVTKTLQYIGSNIKGIFSKK
jgi:hypothetical protein